MEDLSNLNHASVLSVEKPVSKYQGTKELIKKTVNPFVTLHLGKNSNNWKDYFKGTLFSNNR